jgi:hypothetical protein
VVVVVEKEEEEVSGDVEGDRKEYCGRREQA